MVQDAMSGERPRTVFLLQSSANSPSNIQHRTSSVPELIWRVLDLIVGGVFIYAGLIKALDPIGFANDIDNYQTLPWAFSVRLAFFLPWLEILCGLALITRRLYLGGLSVLASLISVFIVATIVAKARGLDITCGCFGHPGRNLSFTWHLLIDFALCGALLLLWRHVRRD
jgi:putative oxidoreductase